MKKYKCYCKSCKVFSISYLTERVFKNAVMVGYVGKCKVCGGGAAVGKEINEERRIRDVQSTI